MSDGLWQVLALMSAVIGMAAFALANEMHWRQLFGSRKQAAMVRTGCKSAGAAALALSFGLCAMADPVAMAILVWPMLLGVAAAIVATCLTVHARRRAAD